MDREETKKVMKVLKAAYPQFYKGLTATDANEVIDLWAAMFSEDEFTTVLAAVKALLATDDKGYPPHIGAVKAKVRLLTTPSEMSEGEAWGLVYKALQNSAYGSKEEFDKLPYEIQYTVGSADVLRSWATQESDSLSVLQSNFQRAYRARAQYAKEVKALPADVRQAMGQLVGKFDLNAYLLQEGADAQTDN